MRPYARAKQIFLAALDRPAEARAEFVASQCAGDDLLQHEVMSLLAYHEDETTAGDPGSGAASLPDRIGPYRVTRLLGEGGMGRVLLAEDDAGRPVALKLLRRELMSADLVARFSREADALARLDHAGMARLLGSGVQATPAGPQHWLALEYVEGPSLTEWAAAQPSEEQRLELITHLCDALQHAHEQGVVHRDLKPENVIVRADGRPVLLDFGIARFTDAELRATIALTRTGLLMGTVRYMSPEQAEGRADDVGARSDQYSLAVMAYELLAGRLPYDLAKKSVHSALATLMTAEPQPLTELKGPRRRGLERVLGKALEKAPESRYASVAEFAADLCRVREGHAPLAPPRRRALWRRGDVRALAGLAGLAVLVASLAVFVNDRLARTDVRQQWPHLNDELTRANALIQLGPRTPEDLERGLALLTSADRRLAAMPTQPWTVEVRRFVSFRRGEAELFLGERLMDPQHLRSAMVAFQSCVAPVRLQPVNLDLPDTDPIWVSQAAELTTSIARATWSAATMDLAKFEGPGTLLTLVDGMRWSALLDTRAAVSQAGGMAKLPPYSPLADAIAFRQNGVGEVRVAQAEIGGLTSSLDAAIDTLREAMRGTLVQSPAASIASSQHNLGWGYLVRYEQRHAPADLDSAETRLNAALGWRITQPGNTSRNETARLLSRVAIARAARAADPRARLAALDAARALLVRIRADVPADAHPLHRMLLELPMVEVELRMAEAGGDRAWLARADSTLAAPSAMPTRLREPVMYAKRERALALADLVAVTRFGEATRAASLREHVANALYAVPRGEWPALADELERMQREGAGR